jgi:hypothetical protein
VIRAATDFYWRNKLPAEAIATLTAAAARANAGYRSDFTYEAARKSTEVRQFPEARKLLAPLLAADPFNARYLAAMADTYAQAADDAGLRDFYLAAIDSMKQAPLAADERTSRIAALRRGLIPALTRLNNFSGGIDEYIELVNHYPEDQGLIHEAATYAGRHSLSPRLTDYYAKAATDSPKDYRWPMVSARRAGRAPDALCRGRKDVLRALGAQLSRRALARQSGGVAGPRAKGRCRRCHAT